MKIRSLPLLSLVSLLVLALAAPSFAQDWKGRGRLQGRVKTEDGKPIKDAKVQLFYGGDETQSPPPIVTKKNGRWSILGLRNGGWSVVIEAEGFVPSQGQVRVSELGTNDPVEITMRRLEDTEEAKKGREVMGWIEEANSLIQAGKFADARALYENALEEVEGGSRPSLLQGVAQTYLQEGNLPKAEETLDRVLTETPDDLNALTMKARVQGQQGKTDAAVTTLDQLVTLNPDNIDALQLIINLLLGEGREDEAQAYIARLPEGTKVDANNYLNLGIDAYNAGNMEEALRHFDKAAADNPNMPDVFYYRGLAHLASGDLDKAKIDLQHVVDIDAAHPKAAEAKELLEAM